MKPLIDVLAEMNDLERQDFSEWFAKLNEREKQAVLKTLQKTTSDRVCTLLSLPADMRITILKGPKSILERAGENIADAFNDLQSWAAAQVPKSEAFRDRQRQKAKAAREKHKEEAERAKRRREGLCEVCAIQLGFLENLLGNIRCKDHR